MTDHDELRVARAVVHGAITGAAMWAALLWWIF